MPVDDNQEFKRVKFLNPITKKTQILKVLNVMIISPSIRSENRRVDAGTPYKMLRSAVFLQVIHKYVFDFFRFNAKIL